MENDALFMEMALNLAEKAGEMGEIPVGAVIVRGGEVIGTGYNKRECEKNPLAHAEIEAIYEASQKLGGWRMSDCELYVTLEPCPMCAGAIINSRIKRVIYGTKDSKSGAFGSVLNMNSYPLNHKTELSITDCDGKCAAVLSEFFKKIRKTKG